MSESFFSRAPRPGRRPEAGPGRGAVRVRRSRRSGGASMALPCRPWRAPTSRAPSPTSGGHSGLRACRAAAVRLPHPPPGRVRRGAIPAAVRLVRQGRRRGPVAHRPICSSDFGSHIGRGVLMVALGPRAGLSGRMLPLLARIPSNNNRLRSCTRGRFIPACAGRRETAWGRMRGPCVTSAGSV